MNSTRRRLLLSWSLLAVWAVLLMLHHPFLAWCIILFVLPLVRLGLPRLALSPSLQVLLLCLFIGFLAAGIIGQYYILPSALAIVGQIIGALVGIPLLFWLGYSDYKTFRATPNAPA